MTLDCGLIEVSDKDDDRGNEAIKGYFIFGILKSVFFPSAAFLPRAGVFNIIRIASKRNLFHYFSPNTVS